MGTGSAVKLSTEVDAVDEASREMVDTGGRDPCPGGEEGVEEAQGDNMTVRRG